MALVTAAFSRDANRIPITQNGLLTTDAQTLVGTAAATVVPIFGITGTVMVNAIYGVVTTALGVNNTAAYWRLNDGTAQSNITLNTGTALSAAPVGSVIAKSGLAAAALVLISSSQERVTEPTTLETMYFSPFLLTQKTGAVATNVEFVYSTTDNPTTGAITFFIGWIPVSADGLVTAL